MTAIVVGSVISLANEAGAAYPGRNGFIAFSLDETGSEEYFGSQIWRIRANGSDYRALSDPCDGVCGFRAPAWSADGAKLFAERVDEVPEGEDGEFISESAVCAGDAPRAIWSMNPYGAHAARLETPTDRVGAFRNPHPSPDGQKVVYEVYNAPVEPGIWIAKTDGSEGARIGYGHEPRFSPDGDTIAYYRNRLEYPGIWLMNTDGTNVRQVNETRISSFDWTPNGKRLVYATRNGRRLHSVRVDGSREQLVTHRAARSIDESPSVSPDGRKVAFVRYIEVDEPIKQQLRYTNIHHGPSKLIRKLPTFYFEDEVGSCARLSWRPRP